MKYKVKVTETLSREIEIDASSIDDAVNKIEEQWDRADIILDADDFSFVDFKVIDYKDKQEDRNYLDNFEELDK